MQDTSSDFNFPLKMFRKLIFKKKLSMDILCGE